MRLRLDKLVLSAGLALAMVATTIPVIPTKATPANGGFYVNGVSQTADDIAEAVQTEAGKNTDNGSNVKITAGTLDTAHVGTVSIDGKAAKAKLDLYEVDNELTSLAQVQNAPGPITTTQEFTYALNKSITVKDDTNGTPAVQDDDKTPDTDESKPAVAAVITERDAAVTEAIAELNALGIGKFEKLNSSTPAPGTGTYTVNVKYTAPEKATSTDYGKLTYSHDTGNIVINVSEVNGEKKATITCVFTVKNVHEITNLSALGATYKFVEKNDNNTAGTQYTLLKVSTDGTIDEVKTGYGSAEGTDLSADITDLTCAYYLATKTVSTSDKLTVSPEEDATYTGVIGQITKAQLGTTSAEKLAEAIEANSAKLVAYLNVAAYKTDDAQQNKLDETPYELTFKIAVPADVDTTGVVFKVLRYHGSTVDVLDTTVSDGYIYFKTDKFSDYALVTVAADTTTPEEASNPTDGTTVADATDATAAAATEAADSTADSSTTATKKSPDMGDNSMMPLFMTTLLLALCAGSLAIYKEKKTN